MALWKVNRGSTALSTSNDFVTIVAGAANPIRIWRVKFAGAGTASAYNEVLMQRSSSGSTPGGAITPEKVDTTSSSATFSVYTTWGVQPTLSGGPLERFGVNSNGGIDPWVALPGEEIKVPAGGQVSFRSASGTGNVLGSIVIED